MWRPPRPPPTLLGLGYPPALCSSITSPPNRVCSSWFKPQSGVKSEYFSSQLVQSKYVEDASEDDERGLAGWKIDFPSMKVLMMRYRHLVVSKHSFFRFLLQGESLHCFLDGISILKWIGTKIVSTLIQMFTLHQLWREEWSHHFPAPQIPSFVFFSSCIAILNKTTCKT